MWHLVTLLRTPLPYEVCNVTFLFFEIWLTPSLPLVTFGDNVQYPPSKSTSVTFFIRNGFRYRYLYRKDFPMDIFPTVLTRFPDRRWQTRRIKIRPAPKTSVLCSTIRSKLKQRDGELTSTWPTSARGIEGKISAKKLLQIGGLILVGSAGR